MPRPTALSDHTILIGYGRVGSLVGAGLQQRALPYCVIEDASRPQSRLQADGVEAIHGNAALPDVLGAANVAAARRLIVAIPNAFEAGQIVETARAANPGLTIIARAHSDAEVEHLTSLGAGTVIMGEREIARGIIEEVVAGDTRREPATPPPDAPAPASPAVAQEAAQGSHI